MIINRKSWDETFFAIAQELSERSTCKRRHYGCIIVRDKTILSSGFNGAPRGLPHCIDIGCAREGIPSGTHHELCRATHAEQNAIANAARTGMNIYGSTIYIMDVPCTLCAKILINVGIEEVKSLATNYPDYKQSLELFALAGIPVIVAGKRMM